MKRSRFHMTPGGAFSISPGGARKGGPPFTATVWKITPGGSVVWAHNTGGSQNACAVDSQGNVATGGNVPGVGNLFYLSPDGNRAWEAQTPTGSSPWEMSFFDDSLLLWSALGESTGCHAYNAAGVHQWSDLVAATRAISASEAYGFAEDGNIRNLARLNNSGSRVWEEYVQQFVDVSMHSACAITASSVAFVYNENSFGSHRIIREHNRSTGAYIGDLFEASGAIYEMAVEDGTIWVVGQHDGAPMILRLNSSGTVLASAEIIGGTSICAGPDGTAFVGGSRQATVPASIWQYDADCNLIWHYDTGSTVLSVARSGDQVVAAGDSSNDWQFRAPYPE